MMSQNPRTVTSTFCRHPFIKDFSVKSRKSTGKDVPPSMESIEPRSDSIPSEWNQEVQNQGAWLRKSFLTAANKLTSSLNVPVTSERMIFITQILTVENQSMWALG